ncbi:MAG: DedA family protein [Dehalococcoidia bacterium]
MEELRQVADALLAFADHHIYVALFLFLLIEEAGIPLPAPGDTLILLAGAQIARGDASTTVVVLLVVLATLLGSAVLYWISRLGGMPVVQRVCEVIHIKEQRLERPGRWIRENRGVAIVFGRLTPGLRTVTSIAAGIFQVNYGAFLAYTALSATIWALIYILLGAAIHSFYRTVAHYLFRPSVLSILLLAFVIAAATVAIHRRRAAARERRLLSEQAL